MLDGLDAIDWPALTHAYGPAGDVPGMLRHVAGGDPDARARAIWELWGSVWHQGTVYEATPFAVPFIAALAANQSFPADDRWQLIWMLGEIALGNPVDGDDLAAVHASHAAVALAAPDIVRELPAEPGVRWALVGLAAAVPEAASEAVVGLGTILEIEVNRSFRAAGQLTRDLITGQPVDDAIIEGVLKDFPKVREAAWKPEEPFGQRWSSIIVRWLIEDGSGSL